MHGGYKTDSGYADVGIRAPMGVWSPAKPNLVHYPEAGRGESLASEPFTLLGGRIPARFMESPHPAARIGTPEPVADGRGRPA